MDEFMEIVSEILDLYARFDKPLCQIIFGAESAQLWNLYLDPSFGNSNFKNLVLFLSPDQKCLMVNYVSIRIKNRKVAA